MKLSRIHYWKTVQGYRYRDTSIILLHDSAEKRLQWKLCGYHREYSAGGYSDPAITENTGDSSYRVGIPVRRECCCGFDRSQNAKTLINNKNKWRYIIMDFSQT